MKGYHIYIDGFWLDSDRKSLPTYQGVYFVYRCSFNPVVKTVDPKELLYIGKTKQNQGICDRLSDHEKHDKFEKSCREGEVVCYACAKVDISSLSIVENALIYAEQPPLNDQLKDHFNYGEITIETDGYNNELEYTNFYLNGDELATIEVDDD